MRLDPARWAEARTVASNCGNELATRRGGSRWLAPWRRISRAKRWRAAWDGARR